MRYLLVICLLAALSSNAQLVNIESQRMHNDSIRAAGNVNLSYSFQQTNGISTSRFRSSLAFQLKSKSLRHIYLILGSYDLARSFGMTSNHAAFAHLRYNYKINNWLRWEVYTQWQFNELLSLKSRALAGTGARIKVSDGKAFSTYFGISSFYEYEEVVDPEFSAYGNVRLSTYGVISWKFPKDRGEFTSVTYYQPSFEAIGDYRITSQNALIVKLTKYLSFTTHFNYFTDSNPPDDVHRETFSLENGLRFTL